ncbi:MAG: hypothetical protein ACXVWF_07905, partial [Actinomycetota bacterium]
MRMRRMVRVGRWSVGLGALALIAVACSSGSSTSSTAGSDGSPAPVSGTLRLFAYSDGFAPAY